MWQNSLKNPPIDQSIRKKMALMMSKDKSSAVNQKEKEWENE